ncbi:hypothetical protein J437_LFUL001973 [Ladona fulva]|uniref:Uncharacterized protein n=1 Tax=Ladona fulva TaxID=123851 RepID=A0A8K0JW69_LADFU|nr:hypothetical protein J437_LFUL001973 [Ladona fulva]
MKIIMQKSGCHSKQQGEGSEKHSHCSRGESQGWKCQNMQWNKGSLEKSGEKSQGWKCRNTQWNKGCSDESGEKSHGWRCHTSGSSEKKPGDVAWSNHSHHHHHHHNQESRKSHEHQCHHDSKGN